MNDKLKKLHGWLLLDKPCGITSAASLNVIKKIIKPVKIGHAGTLDPFASGLLPVAIGEATKTVQYAMMAIKEYAFEVSWGESRDTIDREGNITATSDVTPSRQAIEAVLPVFVGKQLQVPPVFSAVKIKGRRSCDLAREGVITDLKAKLVELFDLKIIEHATTKTGFYAKCGKGYYIRALARDMAEKLGVCGHVSSLKRLSVGEFNIKNTISLDFIEQVVHTGGPSELERYLYPLHTVLDGILVQYVSEEQSQKLRLGQKVPVNLTEEELIVAMLGNKLVAMCNVKDGFLHPIRVFNI